MIPERRSLPEVGPTPVPTKTRFQNRNSTWQLLGRQGRARRFRILVTFGGSRESVHSPRRPGCRFKSGLNCALRPALQAFAYIHYERTHILIQR